METVDNCLRIALSRAKNERLAIGTSKWCGGGPPGAPFFPALFATISPASKEVGHLMYHQPWQWHCHSEKSAVHNILIVCIIYIIYNSLILFIYLLIHLIIYLIDQDNDSGKLLQLVLC